jgi:predicted enzyme related to lactoylglutathione lyase
METFMPRVIHFEIHAEDPQRAIQFYTKIFAWEFTKWAGPKDYWVIKTGPDSQPGINGGLVRRMGTIDGQAVIAYVCTVDVHSVDEAVAVITGSGGTIALPKMAIPGVGWLAYAKDTEGNIFGVMSRDAQAK